MEKAIIFLVNSLSNGGAERVVSNMANEMAKNGLKVFILTVYNDVTYDFHDNIEIISLSKRKLNKYKKIGYLPFLVHRLNQYLNHIFKNYEVKLITSHLLYSNLLSRLSKYRQKTIQVVHIPYQPYDKHNHWLFQKGIQFLYNHTPIVTVSNGCMHELLDIYHVKTKKITTIYNPINLFEIQKKSQEKLQIKKPYILFVGRLSEQKRPELMLDIFYQGKFYENYHLYYLGTGPLEKSLQEKVKNFHLEESVTLKGWCSNVYPYMKSASILVNTSSYEAFPMILIEALACNCKIVSFDIPYGPNEILKDDLSCYLARNQNIEDMIQKIRDALVDYPNVLENRVRDLDVALINEKYMQTYLDWNNKHG